MRDRTGEVWQMNYLVGHPTLLVLSSKKRLSTDNQHMHRCLVIDSDDDGRWRVGEIRTLAGWSSNVETGAEVWGWLRLA